jgi:predicted glutamine amidotransferase
MAQLSVRPEDAWTPLAGSPCSLLAQSGLVPGREQEDGWGLAHYPPGSRTPRVVLGPGAAYRSRGRFRRAAGARGRIVLGHVRAASNPRGLPKSRLLGRRNVQPFVAGRWAIAHNGALNQPDSVARRLGPLRRELKGVNDSEVLFLLFRRELARTRDPLRAFEAGVRELWAAWEEAGRPPRPPYRGLNVVASDGRALYAFCHSPGIAARAFCGRRPWGRMAVRPGRRRLLVASERLGRRGWRELGETEALRAWSEGGRVRLRRERLSLPKRSVS